MFLQCPAEALRTVASATARRLRTLRGLRPQRSKQPKGGASTGLSRRFQAAAVAVASLRGSPGSGPSSRTTGSTEEGRSGTGDEANASGSSDGEDLISGEEGEEGVEEGSSLDDVSLEGTEEEMVGANAC